VTDAVVQPCMTSLIEMALWYALFRGMGTSTIAGFPRESYLAYALWASFISRVSSNWMYEYRMVQEIDKGTINAILVRPISFFEFYLSQFMGYKIVTTLFSVPFVLALSWFFNLQIFWPRLPAALALVTYFCVLSHVMSVMIAACAFFFNRTYAFTAAKNLLLTTLTGELLPLDIMPPTLKSIVLALPFSSAVYRPVAYMTGRADFGVLADGFISVTVGIIVFGALTAVLWTNGLRRYSGTGA
jgi:ABC-2 type transport system permease protein